MKRDISEPHRKALQVNLDPTCYGALAEIGAGQEVARWFFRVGGAAGTVAKTMSAYDMTVSDSIYGPCDRYVSKQRLDRMVEHEYGLLIERLGEKLGETTRFFAFADTVKAKSYSGKGENHGWMGIRFQHEPKAEFSEIIIHVRMLDESNVQQQEAVGIIGVNLIYGAYAYWDDTRKFIASLHDGLGKKRIEVDTIKFSGVAFEEVDNRVKALELVQLGLTDAAMFTADGEVVQAADALYKKCILVERGSFRPVTKTTLDMLDCGRAQFVQEPNVEGKEVIELVEMTLHNLVDGDSIDHQDFLDRVDLLSALGKTVLISNYAEFHRLAAFLFRYTKEMVGIVLGVPTLKQIFEEKYYSELEGGILESFGRLFKNELKLYVYPLKEPSNGAMITAGNLRVAPHLRHLYQYLFENQFIQGLRDINEEYLSYFSRDILKRIRENDSSWEEMVPPQVAKLIRERKLLGCPG